MSLMVSKSLSKGFLRVGVSGALFWREEETVCQVYGKDEEETQ